MVVAMNYPPLAVLTRLLGGVGTSGCVRAHKVTGLRSPVQTTSREERLTRLLGGVGTSGCVRAHKVTGLRTPPTDHQ
ncbi:hypothetical protein GDO78_007937 [Eleutherodactylus coqui]|uniref:Uncharacterized protein n=1 Tax=Eleutherodactylus coqui TaxID=57060 RepID=A0A8J6KE69_ELECQ|nr:hypothetical protein GDO78_007937 [Eleutherodactylus coqui]